MASVHGQSFEDAIQVERISSCDYSATFSANWSIGDVPHGGYVLAIIYRVACTHFEFNHPQRHAGRAAPISLQAAFVKKTDIGTADIRVSDINIGSRVSTIAITVSQMSSATSQRVVKVMCLVTVSDFKRETGLSVTPHGSPSCLRGPPTPQYDQTEKDNSWERFVIPYPHFRKAPSHVEVHIPLKQSQALEKHGVDQQWAKLQLIENSHCISSRWSDEAAIFLLDVFPPALAKLESRLQTATGSSEPVWFPTLTMSIDLKKRLPRVGEEWLHSQVEMMQVRNGRVDIRVALRDASGELIAIASHVCLAMSSARNRKNEPRKSQIQGHVHSREGTKL